MVEMKLCQISQFMTAPHDQGDNFTGISIELISMYVPENGSKWKYVSCIEHPVHYGPSFLRLGFKTAARSVGVPEVLTHSHRQCHACGRCANRKGGHAS